MFKSELQVKLEERDELEALVSGMREELKEQSKTKGVINQGNTKVHTAFLKMNTQNIVNNS